MTPDKKDKLVEEIRLADVAERAHESYLDDYIANKRLTIFNAFCATRDEDELIRIKNDQVALDRLEQDTISVIETGKMARKLLEDEE